MNNCFRLFPRVPLHAIHYFAVLMLPWISSALAAEKPMEKSFEGHIFRPSKEKPTDELIAGLKAPRGFKIGKFAEGFINPRMLAVAPNGDVYLTQRHPGNDVHLLRDADGDGKAELVKQVAAIPNVHGIAIRDGKIYLAAVRELYVADILPDGTLSKPKAIYNDLPDAGQHPNRTIRFSPKGELFLSVGSATNSAPEPNPESATMLVVNTDGSGRRIFASGLRNTIGFDWHPTTGEMWGMDHGMDWMGDENNREELNKLVDGGNYGWPFIFEDGKFNPEDDPKETKGMSWKEYARQCTNSVLTHTAHSAPLAMLFYTGSQFPKEYQGDAFVTLHGSWNRKEPRGYSVVRIKFKDGQPVAFEDFVTGFYLPEKQAQFGRPCGLVMAKDGALLMTDDSSGVVYRISG